MPQLLNQPSLDRTTSSGIPKCSAIPQISGSCSSNIICRFSTLFRWAEALKSLLLHGFPKLCDLRHFGSRRINPRQFGYRCMTSDCADDLGDVLSLLDLREESIPTSCRVCRGSPQYPRVLASRYRASRSIAPSVIVA